MPVSGGYALRCDEAAPGEARAWMRRELSLRYHLDEATVDDALLIVSELVTNAVQSGCRQARLAWHLEPSAITVAVTDDGAGWPQVKNPTPLETNGRGLWIVTRLAARTGVDVLDVGKRVWARLALG